MVLHQLILAGVKPHKLETQMELTSELKQAIAWAVNATEPSRLTYPRETPTDDAEVLAIRKFLKKLAKSSDCKYVELESLSKDFQMRALRAALELKNPLYTKPLMRQALEILKRQ